MKKKRRILILKFTITLVLMVIFTTIAYYNINEPLTGVDDANIFFVYAKNFSEGHGFVYNIGGERVEGFTSLLWVLISSIAFYISSEPEILLLIFNIVLTSISLTALVVFVENKISTFISHTASQKSIVFFTSLISLGWIFFSPGYIIWTTVTLMDSGLWSSALIFGTITSINLFNVSKIGLKEKLVISVAILIILLTRPEGMLWALIFIIFLFMISFSKENDLKYAMRNVILPLSTYVTVIILLTLFRIYYFGYPLPNTYYAKVSPYLIYNLTEGLKYFARFIKWYPLVLVCLCATILGLILNWKLITSQLFKVRQMEEENSKNHLELQYFLIAIVVSTGIIVPVCFGGDHFTLFRFYQPIWPLLLLPCYFLIIYVLTKITNNKMFNIIRNHKYLFITFILLTIYFVNTPQWHNFKKYRRIIFEFKIAQNGRSGGRVLNKLFKNLKRPSVGTITSGGIALTYDGEVIDLMGLNNTKMGHSKTKRKGVKNHTSFCKKIFLELDPDLILPELKTKTELTFPGKNSFSNLVLKGLLFEKSFINKYKPVIVDLDELAKPGIYLLGYFNKNCLDYLLREGFKIRIVE